MGTFRSRSLIVVLALAVSAPWLDARAQSLAGDDAPCLIDPRSPATQRGTQRISMATGIGQGLPIGPAEGSDLEDSRFYALLPRWSRGISGCVAGDSWYRGALEFAVEGALLRQHEPHTGYAAGATALLRYDFLRDGLLIPFVEVGVGFVFMDFDLDRQHDGFNFTPQLGIGLKYPISRRTAITGQWRFHHISNAGLRDPNTGLDGSLFLLGMTYQLD